MNGKERVRRTFAHEEPDRVPIFELTIDNPISSSNSIHPGVRPDYYLAMLATARQVGAYPIAL